MARMRVVHIMILLMFLFMNSMSLSAEDDLRKSSYAYDIEYSSLQELRAWVQRLDIKEEFSEDEIKRALYDYYQIDSSFIKIEVADDKSLVVSILHADRVLYHDQIELNGRVEITIEDSIEQTLTELTADRIIIDDAKKLISALGNVSIKSEQTQETNEYSADSILISYEGFSGILNNAVTRSDRVNSSEETIEFYLTGDEVEINEGIMLLESSFLTSDVEDSYYGLKASTMKALPDGDWFLENATLTLGRVPILYLPFFYYPANTLIFHPSFGYDLTRGWFLNTTTALLGNGIEDSEKEETSFSTFMRMEDITETPYITRDGLILTFADEPKSDLQKWAEESGSYVTLFADVFEDSGIFLSLDSEFKKISIFDDISLFSGIGYSGDDRIRYLFDLEASIEADNIELSIAMPFYSDSDIKSDLLTRKNVFDLDDLFSSDAFSESYSDIDDFSWELKAEAVWEPEFLNPFIEKISLDTLESEVSWDDYDSTTETYSLDSIILPNSSLTVSGRLLDLSFDREGEIETSDEQKEDKELFNIDSPHKLKILDPIKRPQEEMVLLPQMGEANTLNADPFVSQDSDKDIFDLSLSYSVKDTFTDELSYTSDTLTYYDIDHRLTADIDLDLNLFGSALSFQENIVPVYDIEQRESFDDSIDDSFEEDIYLTQNLKVQSDILNLGYEYKSYLYNSDSTDDTTIKHRISLSEKFDLDSADLSFSLSWDIPPMDSVIKPSISLDYGKASLDLSTSITENSDTANYELDPLSLSASYSFDTNSRVSLSYSHDLDDLSASNLKTSFNTEIIKDLKLSGSYSFDIFDVFFDSGWTKLSYDDAYLKLWAENIETGSALFDPGFNMTAFKIDTGELTYLSRSWKNRVTFEAGVSSSWYLDLTDYYDNSLDFNFSLNFGIAEFLDLTFSSISKNTATYAYFQNPTTGFFEDLLMSFNFFDTDQRLASNFNLDSLQVGIVHYMKDWDLHADIIGEIGYNDDDNAWEWQPEATIYLQWKAIPELDFETTIEKDGNDYSLSVE